MNKLVTWILSFTKVGKVVDPVQKFLSGKKANIAGAAIAIPALVTMLTKFADQGTGYLVSIPTTEEFKQFMEGVGIMALRAAVTKAADPAKDPNAPVVAP